MACAQACGSLQACFLSTAVAIAPQTTQSILGHVDISPPWLWLVFVLVVKRGARGKRGFAHDGLKDSHAVLPPRDLPRRSPKLCIYAGPV